MFTNEYIINIMVNNTCSNEPLINVLDYSKEIYDPIHGFIKLSKMACLFIDTEQFQRLRYLRQLGTCYYIFPGACHTRFEHSIGTYYLAGKVLESIKNNSNINIINKYLSEINELQNYLKMSNNTFKLDNFICELIKISALCHDLGHGPFSHMFDDIFIKSLNLNNNSNLNKHEVRSCEILKFIIYSNPILKQNINDDLIKFMCNIINPSCDQINFIYQIVSNNFNNIDVDKFDYIARDTHFIGLKYGIDFMRLIDDMKVINNIICYPEKVYYDLISLFETRYRLHKQIYCHKTVISIQFMINEIMLLLNDIIQIYNSINDINQFTNLTDEYIISYLKFSYKNKNSFDLITKNKIEKAYNIWQNINLRKLYKCEKSIVSNKKIIYETKENLIVFSSKIGFVSGSKNNPLDNLYFYKSSDPNVCFKGDKDKTSFLIPTHYQEYIYLFFNKN